MKKPETLIKNKVKYEIYHKLSWDIRNYNPVTPFDRMSIFKNAFDRCKDLNKQMHVKKLDKDILYLMEV